MAFYRGQLITDAESLKSREWLLEGLPARNRFLMKHIGFVAPKPRKLKWLDHLTLKAWKFYLRLYKQASPPDEEAIHTKWDRPLKMKTPRTQYEESRRVREATPSTAVSWGKAVLEQTDGRMISLLPGVGPNGLG